jgi:hypothetical protein
MNRRTRPNALAIPATERLLFVSGWLFAAMVALTLAAQLG